MKSVLIPLILLSLTCPAGAEETTAPAVDPAKKEMMEKYKAFATPGEAHQLLAPLAGNWTYTSKWWETADGKPMESSGKSTIKMIMGGRFLQQELKGKSMGQPFEGKGVTGYNNLSNKYESVWIDNMATGMIRAGGEFDKASNTLKETGEFPDPLSKEKTRSYRSEWKIVDKNNSTFTIWSTGPEGGAEYKQLEMIYKRAK